MYHLDDVILLKVAFIKKLFEEGYFLKLWLLCTLYIFLNLWVLLLQQFNQCISCAALESAFIKLHAIIWTSDLYASIVQQPDK